MATGLSGLSRLHYCIMAVPLAVILYTGQGFVGFTDVTRYLVKFFIKTNELNAEQTTSLGLVHYTLYRLLVIPLIVVATGRLKALGWSPWLALPMLVSPLLRLYGNWNFPYSHPDLFAWALHLVEPSEIYAKSLLVALAVWPLNNPKAFVAA